MFQQASRWKKFFRISKKTARNLQNGLESGLEISGPKTEVVIVSSICEEIRESTKNIVWQENTLKFATSSTAIGITIDNKLNFEHNSRNVHEKQK